MRNPVDEDQETRDRREKIVMEEPTAITIEFLRARLLSERSISRAATERANELAKRVMELEEQLKIVTLQRKKAAKAAAQVLAVLESNGINELSEECYSDPDEAGIHIESKASSQSMKEGENLTTSRKRINQAELSGWELQTSPLTGGSLPWKSCGSSNSVEKKRHINQSKRLTSPVSVNGSSRKQHLGKSSSLMKQKEIRSAFDKERDGPHALEVLENGAQDDDNTENDMHKILKGDAKDEEEKVSLDVLGSDSLEDQRQETNGGLFANGNGKDADVERALEHQAQLIGRYEAEENAQREWEEKFGEQNCCTPDYCEPGNQSDITEESNDVRDEEKDEVTEGTAETVDTTSAHGRGNLGVEQVWHDEAITKTVPNGNLHSHFDSRCLQDQQANCSTVNKSKTSMLEFPFPEQEKPESELNRKQKQNLSESSLLHNPLCRSVEHRPVHDFSSFNVDGSLCTGELSGIQNELQAAGHHGRSPGLGSVLEALKFAKLSLNHKLSSLPLPIQSRPMEGERETPVLAIEGSDTAEIPIKCGGLLQVPSSSQFKVAATCTNVSGAYSDSNLSLRRHYPSSGVGVAGDYHRNLEMPITPQFETTACQRNLLGIYPDSRLSLTGYYPSTEVGFAGNCRPNLERPTSSELEATDIQRNFLKTYPDSRSNTMRYYPSTEALVAANKHMNPEMGLGTSSHRSLIDPYVNIGISHSAYSRNTCPSYADNLSKMPTNDEFSRPYGSMGSVMPAGDSSSAYDGQFRWNMHQR